MSLTINEKVPNFILPNQNDEIINMKNIKSNLVLFFYPKDNTPGCTLEAIDFSKNIGAINDLGFLVFGISKDSTKKHRNFIEKHKLLVDLLSDEKNKTCEDYGVWVEKSMYGRKYFGIERTTFLILKNKKILNIWKKVKVKGHTEEVINFIKAL